MANWNPQAALLEKYNLEPHPNESRFKEKHERRARWEQPAEQNVRGIPSGIIMHRVQSPFQGIIIVQSGPA